MCSATTIEVTLPRLHPGQREVLAESARYNVLDCGRRWGKTTFGIALVDPVFDGERVGWFAPTYKMLLEAWRELRDRIGAACGRISKQEHRMELLTGGLLEFWSLDKPDAARGRFYDRAIIDEAASVRELKRAWLEVIRPTLADTSGDAWFLSTPRGLNFFHTLFQRGQDTKQADWKSWQKPMSDNPYIDPAEIDHLRRELPERVFQQEIMAQFIEDGGLVFRGVQDAATATPQEQAQPGHAYVMGVDWGKFEDFTVLTVIDTTENAMAALDRFNQIDYRLQRKRLRALWERFDRPQVIAEKNSMGDPVIEELQREGVPVQPFTTTNASKSAAVNALALAFEQGVLQILDDSVLLGELRAYEMERLPSGTLRYNAPSGMHDDCVMSLALAWHGASKPALSLGTAWRQN